MNHYEVDDLLENKPRAKQFRDDIKTAFDAIRNFTLAFAVMHMISVADQLFPQIYQNETNRVFLILSLFGLSQTLYIFNIFWLITSSKLRNVGKFKYLSLINMAIILISVSYVWYSYFVSHIWFKVVECLTSI